MKDEKGQRGVANKPRFCEEVCRREIDNRISPSLLQAWCGLTSKA